MILYMIEIILSFYAALFIINLAIAIFAGFLGLAGRAADHMTTSRTLSNDDRWNFKPEEHGMKRYDKA